MIFEKFPLAAMIFMVPFLSLIPGRTSTSESLNDSTPLPSGWKQVVLNTEYAVEVHSSYIYIRATQPGIVLALSRSGTTECTFLAVTLVETLIHTLKVDSLHVIIMACSESGTIPAPPFTSPLFDVPTMGTDLSEWMFEVTSTSITISCNGSTVWSKQYTELPDATRMMLASLNPDAIKFKDQLDGAREYMFEVKEHSNDPTTNNNTDESLCTVPDAVMNQTSFFPDASFPMTKGTQFFLVCRWNKTMIAQVKMQCDGDSTYSAIDTTGSMALPSCKLSNGYPSNGIMISESLTTFSNHCWQVSSADFNPSSTQLATTGWDRSIFLYSVNELSPIYEIKEAHSLPITCIRWIDSYFLTTSTDKTVMLWDSPTGKSKRKFSGHLGWVMSVEVVGGEGGFVTSSWDHTLAIWDIDHPRPVSTLSGHMAGVWSSACLPQSKVIASASEDCTIRLWDRDSGRSFATLAGGHNDGITTVTWPSNEFVLGSASTDSRVILWDTRTCKVLSKIDTQTKDSPVKCILALPGHRDVIAGIAGPYLKIWALSGNSGESRLTEITSRCFPNDLECLSLAPDGVCHVLGDVSATTFFSLFGGDDNVNPRYTDIKSRLSAVLDKQEGEGGRDGRGDRLPGIPVIRDEGNRSPRGASSSCSDSGVDVGVVY